MPRAALLSTLLLGAACAPGCQCQPHVAQPGVERHEAGWSASLRRPPPALRVDVDHTSPAALDADKACLEPLHRHLGPPKIGEWLAEHDEAGQTFAQYREAAPTLPGDGGRDVIYIQPLGGLDATERRVVELAGDYLQRFFGLSLRLSPGLPLELLPERARRVHPHWGGEQILSSFVLEEVLEPRLPSDAAALISFTTADLWPGPGYNFVFGQASLQDRVGIWSMHRNGDPHHSEEAFRRALWRTLKTAVHEVGHMFSVEHCTAYECVMNGSNSLEESDARPLWLCPECLAKVAWATEQDPRSRYLALLEFAQQHGLTREAAFFERSIEALRHAPPPEGAR